VEHGDLVKWIEAYERAWRTPGTALLRELFASDATYTPAPFMTPLRGRDAIASFWEAERESADEIFAMEWKPVALDGEVGVVRVEVRYGDPPQNIYRNLWIVTLDHNRRCSAFEEWPFFPGQPLAADSQAN
jgi:SnoaL-like domain